MPPSSPVYCGRCSPYPDSCPFLLELRFRCFPPCNHLLYSLSSPCSIPNLSLSSVQPSLGAALPRYVPTIPTSKALPGIATKSLFDLVRGSCFAFTATMVITSKMEIARVAVIVNMSKSDLGKKTVWVALTGLGHILLLRSRPHF